MEVRLEGVGKRGREEVVGGEGERGGSKYEARVGGGPSWWWVLVGGSW